MNGICSTHGSKLHKKFGQKILKELNHYEDLGTDGYLAQDMDTVMHLPVP
jgi:hypothetical protein